MRYRRWLLEGGVNTFRQQRQAAYTLAIYVCPVLPLPLAVDPVPNGGGGAITSTGSGGAEPTRPVLVAVLISAFVAGRSGSRGADLLGAIGAWSPTANVNGAPWAALSDRGADEGETANGLTNAEG